MFALKPDGKKPPDANPVAFCATAWKAVDQNVWRTPTFKALSPVPASVLLATV